jgi:7-keto-8-aminopelargonate synthetase-like enzyme
MIQHNMRALSAEQKHALIRDLLQKRQAEKSEPARTQMPDYTRQSYDMFMLGSDPELTEIRRFDEWVESSIAAGRYTFETPRQEAQRPENTLVRENGEQLPVINMASYNYLGLSYHPEVVQAAKDALDRYGLGVSSSPVAGGTILLHRQLENALVDFLAVPGRGASLFTTGYNVNTGTLSAVIKPGGHVVLDSAAHMSLVEGAQLSRGHVHNFAHNDVADLERILRDITREGPKRIVVCAEGVYSSDGDFGDLAGIVSVARRYGAMVLVDEAHSILATGPHGRGVAAAQGVLDQIDLFVITFSKALGAIGGAVIARRDIARYISWYARCRLFSCGLDPAVTGGVLQSLRMGAGPVGDVRRERLHALSTRLRGRLRGHVRLIEGDSWIVPVIYGPDERTLLLTDYMQRAGLETSIVQYPAVPRHLSRMRLFLTSEHTPEQIDRAADIIVAAAETFGFAQSKDNHAPN